MKPKVDKEKCIGCGTCASLCPAVFKMGDDNKSHVLKADYDAQAECITKSIGACPTQAISK